MAPDVLRAFAMASELHDTIVEMLRSAPSTVLTLLDRGGSSPPEGATITPGSETFSSIPFERRADSLFELRDVAGVVERTVIVEVQLGRDDDKRWSWPAYQAFACARHRAPCDVLVVAPAASVAAWAGTPIALGGRSVFRAVVIGPEELSPALVKVTPELAFLAALAHGEKEPTLVVKAATRFDELPTERAELYFDVVLSILSPRTREAVEQLMQTSKREFKSEFMRGLVQKGRAEGKAEGRIEGKAEGVLQVLDARGIAVSTEHRARILGCTDVGLLDRWIRMAVALTSVDELFVD